MHSAESLAVRSRILREEEKEEKQPARWLQPDPGTDTGATGGPPADPVYPENDYMPSINGADPTTDDQVACISKTLSVEYEYDLVASDQSSAMAIGDYVNRIVHDILTQELVSYVDCSKGIVTDISVWKPTLTGDPCSVNTNFVTSASTYCFRMMGTVELSYTGPENKTDDVLNNATGMLPGVFETMDNLLVKYITENDESTTESANDNAGNGMDTGTGTETDNAGNVTETESNGAGTETDDANAGGTETETIKDDDVAGRTDTGTGTDNGGTNSENGNGTDSGNGNGTESEKGNDGTDTVTGSDERDSSASDPSGGSPDGEMTKGGLTYLVCFLVAVFLTAVLFVVFYIKKKQKQQQAPDLPDISKPVPRVTPRAVEMGSPQESATSGESSFDSGFFHPSPPKSSSMSYNDSSYAESSNTEAACSDESPPRSSRHKFMINDYSSPSVSMESASPVQPLTSTRSLQYPIGPNQYFDEIVTPEGRRTRVHVQTFDATTDRSRSFDDYQSFTTQSPFSAQSRSFIDTSIIHDDTVDL